MRLITDPLKPFKVLNQIISTTRQSTFQILREDNFKIGVPNRERRLNSSGVVQIPGPKPSIKNRTHTTTRHRNQNTQRKEKTQCCYLEHKKRIGDKRKWTNSTTGNGGDWYVVWLKIIKLSFIHSFVNMTANKFYCLSGQISLQVLNSNQFTLKNL